MNIPNTQYTKCNQINIAYQVFGEGAIDIVYIPGWISNIDLMWSCPELVDFFEKLSKNYRVILFDKRGTGLSDRMVELSTLEERMEDINAVMETVGSKKAVLFGHSEGGSVSALFSATYPEKVIALIAFGIFAKRRYSDDYPWAPTDEERQKVYDLIENNWCGEKMQLQSLAPSKVKDQQFMNWLTSYFRSGASPTAALKLTKMNTEVDIVDVLKYINVPTLLMQRTHDVDVKIEEARFVKKHLKNSKFVELEGEDHLFWVGNTNEVLSEIQKFIPNVIDQKPFSKGMSTLLFGQLHEYPKKTTFFSQLKAFIKINPVEVLFLEDSVFAINFRTSGVAVRFGLALINFIKSTGTSVKIGAYTKQFATNQYKIVSDTEYELIKNILSKMSVNQFMVTQTIKSLLSGSSFIFKANTCIVDFITYEKLGAAPNGSPLLFWHR